MPKILSKMLLNRLVRSSHFRRQLEDIHQISGLECLFLDPLGNERLRAPRKISTPLREAGRRVPKIAEWITQSRLITLAGGEPLKPSAWCELSCPIAIEQEVAGYLVISAWRGEEETEAQSLRFWVSLVKQGVALSWNEWQSWWTQMPIYNASQRNAWKRFLALQAREALCHLETETGHLPNFERLPPLVQKACAQVRERFHESLRLREVAAACGVSSEHLSRVFHQSTGLRFGDYLAETRVNAVCEALQETDDPISKIAYHYGFSTISRFNQCFRDLTGMTPRDWRRRRQSHQSMP